MVEPIEQGVRKTTGDGEDLQEKRGSEDKGVER